MKGTSILPGARRLSIGRRARLVTLVLSFAAAFAAVQLSVLQPQTAAAATVHPAAAAQAAGPAAPAASYGPVTGAGSTWAYPAIHAWIDNLNQFGMSNTYTANGSSTGRNWFSNGQVDYAASEIPYGIVDGNNTDTAPSRGFAYMPDVAGGTTLMYNLTINGQRVTNLRLSGKAVAGIFTNTITMWNDPVIKADNPGLTLPAIQIVPVVRSDGSGATADFTQWMIATNPTYWNNYCQQVGRSPCTQTSTYPVQQGTAMKGQQGDPGVATYVANQSSNGAIGYVEYSWALQEGFPVAKLLNAAGYYTLPSPGHVAVSLLKDSINTNPSSSSYLTQNLAGVYTNTDPRNYELSAYSYLVLPTDTSNNMNATKGYTLGAFGTYLLCLGQSQVDVLGYSALPINLVEAGFDQLRKIPGATIPAEDLSAIAQCHNPTFSTNGTNTLANNDPQPAACDKQGATQCPPGYQEPTEPGAGTPTGSPTGTPTGGGGGGGGGGTGGGGGGGGGGGTGGGGTGGGGTGGGGTGGGGTGGTGGGGTGGTPTGTSPSTTGATTPGATGSTGTGQNCDPNTGICTPAGGTTTGTTGTTGSTQSGTGSLANSGQPVSDTPITLAGSNGNGVEVTLMALAAGLLFFVSVVPPLFAQAGRRSRQRRGIDDDFWDDANEQGKGR